MTNSLLWLTMQLNQTSEKLVSQIPVDDRKDQHTARIHYRRTTCSHQLYYWQNHRKSENVPLGHTAGTLLLVQNIEPHSRFLR